MQRILLTVHGIVVFFAFIVIIALSGIIGVRVALAIGLGCPGGWVLVPFLGPMPVDIAGSLMGLLIGFSVATTS